jgi:hypothetical protein
VQNEHNELVPPTVPGEPGETGDAPPIVLGEPDEPEDPSVGGDHTEVNEDQPAVPQGPVQQVREAQRFRPVASQPSRLPVRVPHRHNTRLQNRRDNEDRVLVTSGVTDGKIEISGSAVASITAFLEKRKREGIVDPSANVSVRQALQTRGVEAETVILKELKQMETLKVWVPVRGGELSAAQ